MLKKYIALIVETEPAIFVCIKKGNLAVRGDRLEQLMLKEKSAKFVIENSFFMIHMLNMLMKSSNKI